MQTAQAKGCPRCGRPGYRYVYCPPCWDRYVKPKFHGDQEAEYLRRMAIELNINKQGKYAPNEIEKEN